MTGHPILEVRGVDAGYGGVPAIKGIDVLVNPGEVVAILGANGAGKTTLLHTIAGVLSQMSGIVLFDGEPLSGPLHRRARRGIALVTEERAIIRRLTVEENLAIGTRRPEVALAHFPPLEVLLHKKAGLLSGGEQQMMVLGRVLANEARLLLVDEVSFGLAPLVVKQLFRTLRAAADSGAAVLLVEQHPALALAVAHRGYVLARGQIKLSGTGAELRNRLDQIEQSYLDIA